MERNVLEKLEKDIREIKIMVRQICRDVNEITLEMGADKSVDNCSLSFDQLPQEVQDQMMDDFFSNTIDFDPTEQMFSKRAVPPPGPSDSLSIGMECDMSKKEPNDGEISIYPISYVSELEMKVNSYESILDNQDKQKKDGENDDKSKRKN